MTTEDRPLKDIRQESLQVKETWQMKDEDQIKRQLYERGTNILTEIIWRPCQLGDSDVAGVDWNPGDEVVPHREGGAGEDASHPAAWGHVALLARLAPRPPCPAHTRPYLRHTRRMKKKDRTNVMN